jgi:glutamate dehydrogenase (NAD(P)+)
MEKKNNIHVWEGSELFEQTVSTVRHAASILGIDENTIKRITHPKRALVVSIPVRMDNGEIKVFEGYRVHHNLTLGPGKGGLRYHPSVNLSETAALAMLMTYKASLFALPLGGAKGAINCNPLELSERELQALTRRFVSEIHSFIGPDRDIPAPDIGTNPQVMAWIMDTYSAEHGHGIPGVVTGKPIEIGGSLGRVEATGRGVIYSIIETAKHLDIELNQETAFAIQGFGNVGSIAAKKAIKLGCKVVAVSDVSGGLYNPNGLDISAVIQHVEENKFLKGYKEADFITNEELIEVKCDVLIPAALSGVIHKKNANKVNAKLIAEGANGPLTRDGDDILKDKNTFIIPDILANAGGVTVSYFEYVQDIQNLFWSEKDINNKLWNLMSETIQKTFNLSKAYKTDLRLAAMISGIQRIVNAMKWRGFFP